MKHEISDRQKEILEAAGKILLKSGVKGLTTKALAAEMNFSESAIYRHFKTKEEIIVMLLNVLAENFQNRLPNLIKENQAASDNLRVVFNSQFAFLKKNPHFAVAMMSEGLLDESEEIMQGMLRVGQIKTALLFKIIEQGKYNQEFTKEIASEDLVQIIGGTFRLVLLKWKVSNFLFDIEKEGNHMINVVTKLIAVK